MESVRCRDGALELHFLEDYVSTLFALIPDLVNFLRKMWLLIEAFK